MKKFEIEFKWAIYFILILFGWFYLEKIIGLHDKHVKWEGLFLFLIIIPQVILYRLAFKNKKTEFYRGKMTWKQAFFSGAVLSLLIAGISPIVGYTTTVVISPEFMDNVRAQTGQSADIYSANQFATNLLFSLLSNGIVISAVLALIMRSKQK